MRGRNGAEFACNTKPPLLRVLLLVLPLLLEPLAVLSVLANEEVDDEDVVCWRDGCEGALKAEVVAAMAVKESNGDADDDDADNSDVEDVGTAEAGDPPDAGANAIAAVVALDADTACEAPVLVIVMDLLAFSLPPATLVVAPLAAAALAKPFAALLDDCD